MSLVASSPSPEPANRRPGYLRPGYPRPGYVRSGSAFDLASMLDALRRRWRMFAAFVAVITFVAIVVALRLQPIYTSAAQVKIDPTVHREIDANQPPPDDTPDQAAVDTEVAIMRSSPIAATVVDQLGLANVPEFAVPHVGLIKRLMHGAPPPQDAAGRRETAIATVEADTDVRREAGTYVVNVAFKAHDPAMAAKVANALAQAYIANNLNIRIQGANRQAAWLDQRLAALGAQAQSADAALARYKAANGIATLGTNGQTVNDQQIVELGTQLASAESDAAAARSNLSAARQQIAGGGLESVSSVLSSNVIADLRRQRAEVARNAAEINTRYGPLHPESIKVHQQLQGLDQQIRAEGQRVVAGLQSTAQSADARAAALRGALASLKGQQSSNEQATVEADALQREADAKHLIYNQLAQSAQQTSQESQSRETRGRIIELAQPAGSPSYPNKVLFAVTGVILGAVAGFAAVLLLEATDATVRTVEDVEEALGVELVSSVPHLTARRAPGFDPNKPYDFVIRKPMSGFAESLRSIRSTLRLTADGHTASGGTITAITSALPGEGKTTTSAALARIMAMSGEKVLLIDCDLRRPSLGDMTTGKTASLFDALNGRATVAEAIQTDKVAGLDILTSHDPRFSPKDVLGGPEMRRLLETLRQSYDHIVLDAPPVLAVADARTISALADRVLLVVRWRRTARSAAQLALSRLEGDGAHVAGVVLSMVDTADLQAVGANNPAYYARAEAAYYQN